MKNSGIWVRVSGPVLLLLILAIVWFQYSRSEKKTDISFPDPFPTFETFCERESIKTIRFTSNQVEDLLTLTNSLEDCTDIQLGSGIFLFRTSLSLNRTKGLRIQGQGKDKTILKFDPLSNSNGVDAEALDGFTMMDFTVLDSAKNGVEIRLSQNIILDGILVRWSNTTGEKMMNNGAYGIYPVNVTNIILQNSESYFASDAGLYVGQCINALVRYNKAKNNVMGLEIENTINADVYENEMENNTGGFLAYDLNKNTIVSRNIRIHNNRFVGNNFPNFARTGIVKTVPSGVGMVITSTREVEIYNNTIGNNNTVDIGILNGLVSVTPDFSAWPMNNWHTHDIYIHNNDFIGSSGTVVDNGKTSPDRPMGQLLELIHAEFRKSNPNERFPEILIDGVEPGKTTLVFTTWFGDRIGNSNRICLEKNTSHLRLLDMNLPALLQNSEDPTPESISKSIQSGRTLVYLSNTSPPYGGNLPGGFECKGFVFQGFPLEFPSVRGRI